MKIRTTKEAGGMLVTALILSAIMGTALASYLGVVRAQHRSVARSLAWNTALPVAEAGIEEAMAHINLNTNRALAGWTLVGTNYVKSRTIWGVKYDLTVSTDFLKPVITSKASVSAPMSTNVIRSGRASCRERV